jgi:hypothetical protein
MTGRDYINERGRIACGWSWAPVCWFVLGIPIYGLLGIGAGSIIWWSGTAVMIALVVRALKRFRCPYCGEKLSAYWEAGFRYPISGKVKYFPCCRRPLDAELDRGGVKHDHP